MAWLGEADRSIATALQRKAVSRIVNLSKGMEPHGTASQRRGKAGLCKAEAMPGIAPQWPCIVLPRGASQWHCIVLKAQHRNGRELSS